MSLDQRPRTSTQKPENSKMNPARDKQDVSLSNPRNKQQFIMLLGQILSSGLAHSSQQQWIYWYSRCFNCNGLWLQQKLRSLLTIHNSVCSVWIIGMLEWQTFIYSQTIGNLAKKIPTLGHLAIVKQTRRLVESPQIQNTSMLMHGSNNKILGLPVMNAFLLMYGGN